MKGYFIAIEGPDGSGKSTQIAMLEDYFKKKGISCLVTREPGGTPVGEQIRGIILDPGNREMGAVTEMLLYAAARAQLMEEVILPALDRGAVVISDRFVDSSLVYQGIARGLGVETTAGINAVAIRDRRPDRIIFIDIPEEEGLRRKMNQKKLDRMEQEGIAFHHLVSEGYRKVLANRPEVIRIDGCQPVEVVHREITERIAADLAG